MESNDQTEETWLTPEALAGLGTGVILWETNDKEFVKDLSYDDCKELAKGALAFKWVPYTRRTYESLTGGLDESG